MQEHNRYWSRAGRVPVLCAALLLAACGEQAAGGGQRPPTEVGIVTMATQAVSMRAELPGRTTAYMVSEVRPQVGGILQKRLFEEGAEVQEGQVLYQINPAPFQAAVDTAKAALQQAEATQVSARLLAERYAELVEIEAVSKQDSDDAQASYLQAQAAVAQARASLQSARIDLEFTRITAPIAGRVSTSAYTPGALVTAGQAEALTTVRQLDPIFLDITQSSTQLLKLKRQWAAGRLQGTAEGKVPVRLRLEDGSDYEHPGTLAFTDYAVDQSTGTVRLRAVVPNPDGLLLPGMFVRAVVEQGVDPEGLLVPQRGVTRNARGEALVLRLDDDNKVEQRVIETGGTVGDQWIVLSGLSAGDRVVVEGTQKVRPGSVVKPVPFVADAG